MRLKLEATEEELIEKGEALLDALALHLAPHHPQLAEELRKAKPKLPPKEPALKHRVLQELHAERRKEYASALDEYVREAMKILEPVVTKAGVQKAQPADWTKPIYDDEKEAFEIAKEALFALGYKERDFVEGGVLYGLSVNELREQVQEDLRDSAKRRAKGGS